LNTLPETFPAQRSLDSNLCTNYIPTLPHDKPIDPHTPLFFYLDASKLKRVLLLVNNIILSPPKALYRSFSLKQLNFYEARKKKKSRADRIRKCIPKDEISEIEI